MPLLALLRPVPQCSMRDPMRGPWHGRWSLPNRWCRDSNESHLKRIRHT